MLAEPEDSDKYNIVSPTHVQALLFGCESHDHTYISTIINYMKAAYSCRTNEIHLKTKSKPQYVSIPAGAAL